MKQTLQLKLSQHLTLTPQLQQSIRLLQLSTIELNAEVERLLQENPFSSAKKATTTDPQEFLLAGTAPPTTTVERPSREERDSDGLNGADVAPTRDDLPDVTDFSDFGGGGSDGDWGGGNSSSEDDDFSPQQIAASCCAIIWSGSSRCLICRSATVRSLPR